MGWELVDESARLSLEAEESNFGPAESEVPVRHKDGDPELGGQIWSARTHVGAVSLWMAVKPLGRDGSTQEEHVACEEFGFESPAAVCFGESYLASRRPGVSSEKCG